MPLREPGEEFGQYRIVRLVGRGGIGAVYLARDQKLDRDVAIKILPPGQTDAGDVQGSLIREAKAAAGLDHPNICTIYEVGEAPDGTGFIAMQFAEGETLAAAISRGPLPVGEALSIATQIADALAAAHRRGIVHRDLKPQNIILTSSGRPVLLDFGLATAASFAHAETATRTVEQAAGVIRGTPAYMAPEQIQQRPVDGRADLFALGVVLFECLTGRRPFDGASDVEIFGKILHVQAAPVSQLRGGLTERHDELCRRLLAKEPADRYQAAEEVIGVLRALGSDTGPVRPPAAAPSAALGKRWRSRSFLTKFVLATLCLVVVVFAAPVWDAWRGLPAPPADAERWYQRGTDAIREGAYHAGQLALQEAVRLFPAYPIAHARLAEALAELDDEHGAEQQLLRLSSVLPDESRLPADDRLRLKATRAVVLRDMETAVSAYRELADRNRGDATAWLDLGRAQEGAGNIPDARTAYAKAVAINPQSAAAHLRMGAVAALELKRDDALRAMAEAERLHRAAANVEGEAEVTLRRGAFLAAIGEVRSARADLERALTLARSLKIPYQIVRARMALSNVIISEGRFADAEQSARDALKEALDAGLDTLAADGLIDLEGAFMVSGHLAEAGAAGEQALQLAERSGARRTAARARIQLAAVRMEARRSRDAIILAEQAVAYLKPRRYLRFELLGLSVMSRAYQQLEEFERARSISEEIVTTAEALHNDAQVGIALSTLASVTTALGGLPQALAYRERAEAIRRSQHDASALPYDLANRAELLIRLGRLDEASALLAELEAGIKAGNDAYVGRKPRAAFLRAMSAAVALRTAEAWQLIGAVAPSSGSDSVSVLTPALARYIRARQGRPAETRGGRPRPEDAAGSPALARERQYWLAAAALQAQDMAAAWIAADRGLQLMGTVKNDELTWRLCAVGALALQRTGDTGRARELSGRARQALERLRSTWPGGTATYERRPDLAELKARLESAFPAIGGRT